MRKLGLFLIFSWLLVACAGSSSLVTIEDPWTRPTLAGGNAAVYLVMTNSTDQDDRLIGVSGDVASNLEIHMSMAGVDGVMTMDPQDTVPITGNTTLEFAPGGMHVMLMGVTQTLETGDRFSLTFHFEQSGDIQVEVSVEDR